MKRITNPSRVIVDNYEADVILKGITPLDLGEEIEVLINEGILQGKTIVGIVKKVCYDSFVVIKEIGEEVTPAYTEINLVRIRIKDERN